jgi:hypothetical protein
MTMTVEIDPDGRRSIQVFPTLGIDQVGACSMFDDEGLVLFPFLHLGKGMPKIFPVPVRQPIGAVSFGHLNVNSLEDRLKNPPTKVANYLVVARIIRGGDFFDNLEAG